MESVKDTTCGFWFFKGPLLQKAANKKVYVLLYGLLGCFFGATYAYFHGTITTLEKRFKIPSRTTGLISIGGDISLIPASLIVSYYGGKGHRPRWMAFGSAIMLSYCLLTCLPHLWFGPGGASLELTEEFGDVLNVNASTNQVLETHKRKLLCESKTEPCLEETGNYYPQILLFVAQLLGGIGSSIYYNLGVAYMDDNIKKKKTPFLISLTYFLRMLGPAFGYALASFSLKFYVSPNLKPVIGPNDPRWIGAWWMGYLILAAGLGIFGLLIAFFPKTLPRAAARKSLLKSSEPPTLTDLIKTTKRLLKNKLYMFNNFSTIFYCLGYGPYWMYLPKYIEIQFKQSPSVASFATGTVGLVFSAIGVLVSGSVVSKFKPSARVLAAWNIAESAATVLGVIAYMNLGCDIPKTATTFDVIGQCNIGCNCHYKPFSPVCSVNNISFISPCHAGCKNVEEINETKIYSNCSCLNEGDFVKEGNCPIDCTTPFYIFLAVVCVCKFVGASSRSANFLISVRVVEENDKTASMGLGLTLISLLSFVPSPVIFGYIIDKTCLIWGKTCTGTGNCWVYDDTYLRFILNISAASFIAVGFLFDIAIWYYIKGVKMFDDEIEIDSELKTALK